MQVTRKTNTTASFLGKAATHSTPQDASASTAPVDTAEIGSSTKGFFRQGAEIIGGVANAALNIPKAVLPAVVLGGLKGLDELTPDKESFSNETIGKFYAYAGAAQSVAMAGAMGIVGGPVAAAGMVVMEAPREAAGLATFVKGGGAEQVGKELADSVRKVIRQDDSMLEAVGKGSWAALKSAVVEAASVRYQEGKGMVSGVVDGASKAYGQLTAPKEETGEAPQSLWSKAKRVLDTPGHFVQGTMQGYDSEAEWNTRKFILSRIGALSAIGMTAGTLVGAPLLMGGIGAGIGVAQMLTDDKKQVSETIEKITSSTRAMEPEKAFDNPIAQANHVGMEAGVMAIATSLS